MKEELLTVTIDGIDVQVESGATILQAAQQAGVDIPTLCYMKELTPEGSCRMCLVEVEGNAKGLATACSQPCTNGMKVHTKTEKCIQARRFVLDLLLSNHPLDCFNCASNGNCKLQDYCIEYGVEGTSFETPVQPERPERDETNPYLIYDPRKCILCRRCQRTCDQLHGRGVLAVQGRGFSTAVTAPFERRWEETNCDNCGACAAACPVGALVTRDNQTGYRAFNIDRQENVPCPLCEKGCLLTLIYRKGTLVGAEPAHGAAQPDICEKGRFHLAELEAALVK